MQVLANDNNLDGEEIDELTRKEDEEARCCCGRCKKPHFDIRSLNPVGKNEDGECTCWGQPKREVGMNLQNHYCNVVF